ncbi:MAG: hypothetical protein OXI52_01695, partial [Caldilineaceae bacterium]|nr:hypothetical protein [Caldilineaceae bacterium]
MARGTATRRRAEARDHSAGALEVGAYGDDLPSRRGGRPRRWITQLRRPRMAENRITDARRTILASMQKHDQSRRE